MLYSGAKCAMTPSREAGSRKPSLTRLGQTIFLTEQTGDCEVGGAVYFLVPDIDRCFAEFSGRGVSLTAPPADTPWGTREMVATDPDGNRLRFASEASPA